MKKSVKVLCVLLIAIGFINFFAFAKADEHFRGVVVSKDQTTGNMLIARYGRVTEVSESDLQRHRLHGITLPFTHLLMIAAMFSLIIKEKLPKIMFRGQQQERERKEEEVRTSGTPTFSFSCAGKIGQVNFGGPLLKIAVYPQGVHCQPIFMPAFGILASEIESVTVQNSLLRKGVEIVHSSPEIATPVLLRCSNNSTAVSALANFGK